VKTVERILVVGPSWVGDMMMAQTLFILLKRNNPDCSIDVLAPDWSLPILAHMPEISDSIASPFKHGEASLHQRYLLGKSLRDRRYDQAIILPNSLKSALVPYWARVPRRTGFVGELRYGLINDTRKLNRQALPKTVMRFATLGIPANQSLDKILPFPHLETNEQSRSTTFNTLSIEPATDLVLVLCPGAEFGPAKQWPASHFSVLANYYISLGWQVWLLGSEKDNTICSEIDDASEGRCNNLAGKTELGQVIDLMSRASAIVSNDSGLMHIAAALDKPLVAIYGSSDPGFTPPLTDKAKILSLSLSCSPCFKRQCPLGHLDCLEKLDPVMVSDAITSLLENKNNG